MTGHYALTHFVKSYSQAPPDAIDPKLFSHRPPRYSPIAGIIYHPSAFDTQPAQTPGSPELELPEHLVVPAVLAIAAVANMHPLRARMSDVDTAHAHQMLASFWQQTFNEDSPNYIPL